jgi:hypothetical protein
VKASVRFALVALGALVLIAGTFVGLRPITADITVVNPRIIEVAAPCGIGYIPGIPGAADPVPLRTEPGVAVPRAAYDQHCDLAISWQPFAAWGLTTVGLLGLALLFASRRTRARV